MVKSTPKNQGAVLCSGVGSKTKVDYDRDVLIKVVPLTLYGPCGKLDTYGVLDECAERTMILPQAIKTYKFLARPRRYASRLWWEMPIGKESVSISPFLPEVILNRSSRSTAASLLRNSGWV